MMGHFEAVLPLDSVMCLPAWGQDWDSLRGHLSPGFTLQEKFLLIEESVLISNRT